MRGQETCNLLGVHFPTTWPFKNAIFQKTIKKIFNCAIFFLFFFFEKLQFFKKNLFFYLQKTNDVGVNVPRPFWSLIRFETHIGGVCCVSFTYHSTPTLKSFWEYYTNSNLQLFLDQARYLVNKLFEGLVEFSHYKEYMVVVG